MVTAKRQQRECSENGLAKENQGGAKKIIKVFPQRVYIQARSYGGEPE